MPENDLWRYSLDIYKNEINAQACLELQDCCNANVNLLFFYAWIARRHNRLIDPKICRYVDIEISGLVENLVLPLRNVRSKIMKESTEPGLSELRRKVLDLEVDAEKIIQARLFEMTDHILSLAQKSDTSIADTVRCNLEVYETFLGTVFPEAAMNRLVYSC
ncbi:TIGR02444 family protein [Emcibacter sp.]|uniref:TIGR02444 family protein n=1 Tax=Emcibacter sp. TaxID=1979954 RepID=UPI002AA7CC8B|nr:TIGR02444 family protein [Emcibacter sp.]